MVEERVAELVRSQGSEEGKEDVPKALLLTTLRLVANTYAHPLSSSSSSDRSGTMTTTMPSSARMTLLVAGLLHDDVGVRTAGASLAFDVAVRRGGPFASFSLSSSTSASKPLTVGASSNQASTYNYNWTEAERRLHGTDELSTSEREREVELVVALLEALGRERAGDDEGVGESRFASPLCRAVLLVNVRLIGAVCIDCSPSTSRIACFSPLPLAVPPPFGIRVRAWLDAPGAGRERCLAG